MLQYQVDAVPEGLETYYEAKEDGKFVLKVDGLPAPTQNDDAKAKLDEFRNTNIALKRQLEELQSKVGITDESVADQVKRAVAANNEKVAQAEEAAQKYEQLLQKVVLSDKVKEAALKYGIESTAIQDVMNRAESAFTVKDGVPLPTGGEVDSDGQVLTPETWIKQLVITAPHLFKPSVGSGALRPNASGKVNPNDLHGAARIAHGISLRNKR